MPTSAEKPSSIVFDLNKPEEWGVTRYGWQLVINPTETEFRFSMREEAVVDVEDDEHDNFVGFGITFGNNVVFYFSSLPAYLVECLTRCKLTGHNLKSDFHKLRKWSVPLSAAQLDFDTIISSYVRQSTKESHGLKDRASAELGITYPSYSDITGAGRTKETLDKKPLQLVAEYNAMDCLCTRKLRVLDERSFKPTERRYFDELEMPITRLLFDMEERGIKVNVAYLTYLDGRFSAESNRLLSTLVKFCGEDFNPNSPKQVSGRLFAKVGIQSTKTGKEILSQHTGIPLINVLTRFRETTKLRGTYTSPLAKLGEQDNGNNRIHTTFNQVSMSSTTGLWKGIRTGRLSSSEPNLQNIPTRTESGDLLRRAFVGQDNHVLICADYSQIEWRVAAHFSKDAKMSKILLEDRDIYEEIAQKAKQTRANTKTAVLAMNFGAGGYKIASVLHLSNQEGFRFVDAYMQTFPTYFKWRHQIEKQDSITTLLGRNIQPESKFLNVPYMVQGSAADIIKLAMLKLNAAGYNLLAQIHDEILFEQADASCIPGIKEIMESVVKLDVPLVCEPGSGLTWQEAKA